MLQLFLAVNLIQHTPVGGCCHELAFEPCHELAFESCSYTEAKVQILTNVGSHSQMFDFISQLHDALLALL